MLISSDRKGAALRCQCRSSTQQWCQSACSLRRCQFWRRLNPPLSDWKPRLESATGCEVLLELCKSRLHTFPDLGSK